MMKLTDILRFMGRLGAAYFRYGRVLLSERLLTCEGNGARRSSTESHSLHFAGKSVLLCRGTGVEIGSLHKRLPLVANVLYLDVGTTTELRERYRNDERAHKIGQVHLISTNGSYPFIDDNAFDFVASSHVLEHTCNPPRQIEEWLRIIRPGGIVYMIIPDKRFCFDRRRETTPLSHFKEEFELYVTSITKDHYQDYFANTNGEDGMTWEASDSQIESSWRQQANIHVHTFTSESFREFLEFFAEKLSYQLVHFYSDRLDVHAGLRKL